MASSSSISILTTQTAPTSLCLGSGRFLRSVLVPFLSSNEQVAIFQTRGRSLLDYFVDASNGSSDNVDNSSMSYPVDTIDYSGHVSTAHIDICAVGTLGSPPGKQAIQQLLHSSTTNIQVIGVGVTEAGLSSPSNQCMLDLTWILYQLYKQEKYHDEKISIVNTDNVPNNGDVIQSHVLENVQSFETAYSFGDMSFMEFIENRVSFLNSMVDRITSARIGSSGMIPSCEPLPEKALVICDPGNDLPSWMRDDVIQKRFGVKIRSHPDELATDISLKLRVANGTHTALAHAMALSSHPNTETLSSNPSFLSYLDSLFESQILCGAMSQGIEKSEVEETWLDWRKRVQHPYFGLSTFFITQNGAAKGGIRLGPTVKALVDGAVSDGCDVAENPLSVSMAFAFAAILRFLSPIGKQSTEAKQRGIYVGWLDSHSLEKDVDKERSVNESVTYADGLKYNLDVGWYEFRCGCPIEWKSFHSTRKVPLPQALAMIGRGCQPSAYMDVIRSYLLSSDGGDLKSVLEGQSVQEEALRAKIVETFVSAVATLYARMVSGDATIDILNEMIEKQHVFCCGLATSCAALMDGPLPEQTEPNQPLHFRHCPIPDSSRLMSRRVKVDDITSVVLAEVQGQQVIDLHTHLLPPSHGSLCLWGIDELLTYHYLVAEYFMTAPGDMTPDAFYSLSKAKQADIIWDALFVNRSPISEATRGVLTTLSALGLGDHVKSRNLVAIRSFYDGYRKDGLSGAERFSEMAYKLSGVRYAIMTNIPFDSNESQHWRPKKKKYSNTFKSALRVDPLLAGDRKTIENALKASGYGTSLADARKYLHDWCDTINPEYMMASTPHDFYVQPDGGRLVGVKKTGVNEAALHTPFAFAEVSGIDCNTCDGADDNIPSIINEDSDFLVDVLMQVCEERNLPLALKIGAHRAVNPSLLQAGDGMVAFADTASLARLCTRFPKVKFLATFLSRANQHEACVLASKFGNLHIYGCWWYCNNPSIIDEITRMRVEMLGTTFTAQHSDSRVIDQLVYKWSHSRAVIANALAREYVKTSRSGWNFSRQEIRRDVWRMFGGSYEEFMSKVIEA
ncbi:hypothetical protein ACHAXN_008062 [Cyclotella atomus]